MSCLVLAEKVTVKGLTYELPGIGWEGDCEGLTYEQPGIGWEGDCEGLVAEDQVIGPAAAAPSLEEFLMISVSDFV